MFPQKLPTKKARLQPGFSFCNFLAQDDTILYFFSSGTLSHPFLCVLTFGLRGGGFFGGSFGGLSSAIICMLLNF